MPKITQITKNAAAVFKARPGDLLQDGTIAGGTVDDVRFQFTFVFDSAFEDSTTKTLNCTVSYKKHLASSYTKADDYRPTSARNGDANTVLALNETEFLAAFDAYGDYLVTQMTGKETDTLDPSAIAPLSTNGIYLTNNNDRFGKHFHCFPTIPANTTCAKAIDLTGRQLQDFSALMKFLAFNGIFVTEKGAANKTKRAAALVLWNQYHNAPWFQMLANVHDRTRLDTLLQSQALIARHQAMIDYEGAAKKEENEFFRGFNF